MSIYQVQEFRRFQSSQQADRMESPYSEAKVRAFVGSGGQIQRIPTGFSAYNEGLTITQLQHQTKAKRGARKMVQINRAKRKARA